MCLVKYHVLILCLISLGCYALNCRSDGGPKEAELKNIYKKCLKMQDNKNSSRSNSEQDWRDHGQIRHDRDRGRGNKDVRNDGNTDRRDRMGTGMRNRDDMGMNDERLGRNSDRMGNDNMGSGRIGISDGMGKRNEMNNGRHNMQASKDSKYGRDNYGGRDTFSQNEDFDSDMPYNSNYHSSTQMPRRYKREKRPENSGQRSQYNPNIQKITGYHDGFRSEEKNSSENNSNKDNDKKACALHCFLDNLEMTGEDGMPDRYLVTHAITKDVKNEDLKDFLQESIEECFQILDNENTDDKCEFSKNLLMCLSEKGRSNCDDWRDDLKF